MANKPTALSLHERMIIKALLNDGVRNQDIQALVNTGRDATINSGRITGIKKDKQLPPASPAAVESYKKMKRSFDPITGLNPYKDERLIRAREAMKLAVMLYNSPGFCFKTENFAVLANIAWTYLMHEYRLRQDKSILRDDGGTMSLSYMLTLADCPLTKGMRQNLEALKEIRDKVEHKLMGSADAVFLPIYQACCLNFETMLVKLFGPNLSLTTDLSVALQFSKMDIEQASQLMSYEIPESIRSLDANLTNKISADEAMDIEYQFRVIYTLDSASKGKSHIHFVSPDTAEGKEIHNVLQKVKLADDLYPYKPGAVVKSVQIGSSRPYTMADHTNAWKKHNIRQAKGHKKIAVTDKRYCVFHPAHKDFTYSQAWVDLLIHENS
ncbi:DUF3644 domain-containing protein [Ochrobactrum chromiisoli]|uniref:DUF3644 domain-containing protein n=1 Tax=Ochrobactrum chromiisoli TaxID=2993941 RepID=A0ABT3QM74_9HYPH|nr:DUF3644 domain-containing protein [Ochrobactrum chromiisoli]MCX2696701.1 DUF3644 domain-containing protein [Ochrobactrum chromiisoli]